MKNKYTEFMDKHEAELVEDIFTVCRINSERTEPLEGAPYGAGPRAALAQAEALAKAYGFQAQVCGDRVLRVEYGTGEPALAILAHLDVVPAGTGWTKCQPYEPVRQGDMLYGRGVSDDKGPAMASLWSLLAARELAGPLTKKVQLLLGSCEETGSDDVDWYMKNYKLPPMVFTPDGDFPVANVEKGRAAVCITSPADQTPKAPYVMRFTAGTVANAVPGTASCGVVGTTAEFVRAQAALLAIPGVSFEVTTCHHGNTHITCKGVAAHASLPEQGKNAACALLELLARIGLSDSAGNRSLMALRQAIPYGDWAGRAFGAACSDEVSGALTVNLGIVNYSIPDGLRAVVDMRIPVCGRGEEIVSGLDKALGNAASAEALGISKPHMVPGDSPFVTGLMEIYRKYTGLEGQPMSMGGGTYVHDIEGGVAFGCTMPGRNPKMHEPDENMPVSDLLLSAAMFAEAIERFCK